ncbi:hypothetical protein PENSPDRAFT_66936 [Peniophora sp. CONT]|nr:hypothetical protein PENSPDRAFT_66936 [Peniophora sp. CONT]
MTQTAGGQRAGLEAEIEAVIEKGARAVVAAVALAVVRVRARRSLALPRALALWRLSRGGSGGRGLLRGGCSVSGLLGRRCRGCGRGPRVGRDGGDGGYGLGVWVVVDPVLSRRRRVVRLWREVGRIVVEGDGREVGFVWLLGGARVYKVVLVLDRLLVLGLGVILLLLPGLVRALRLLLVRNGLVIERRRVADHGRPGRVLLPWRARHRVYLYRTVLIKMHDARGINPRLGSSNSPASRVLVSFDLFFFAPLILTLPTFWKTSHRLLSPARLVVYCFTRIQYDVRPTMNNRCNPNQSFQSKPARTPLTCNAHAHPHLSFQSPHLSPNYADPVDHATSPPMSLSLYPSPPDSTKPVKRCTTFKQTAASNREITPGPSLPHRKFAQCGNVFRHRRSMRTCSTE